MSVFKFCFVLNWKVLNEAGLFSLGFAGVFFSFGCKDLILSIPALLLTTITLAWTALLLRK